MYDLIIGTKSRDGKKSKIDYLSLANKPSFDLVASFRKAGAYTWTCPQDGEYIALIVGGGGGGCATDDTYSWELETNEYMIFLGGQHGDFALCRNTFSANSKVSLVVGAGGEAATYVGNPYENTRNDPTSGGTSSFDGITADGGMYGAVSRFTTSEKKIPARISDKLRGWVGLDIFLDEEGKPVTMLCDGGDAIGRIYPYGDCGDTYMPSLNKYKLSPSEYYQYSYTGSNDIPTPITPTDCGAGGGALRITSSPYSVDIAFNGAPGADGGVFIYKVR